MLLLGVGWVVLLKRRTRSDLDRAYDALLSSEERFRHQAHHDTLTGLPNRALFVRRLTDAVQRAGEHGGTAAAVLIDLDGFKNVNDTFGHAAGDEVDVLKIDRMFLDFGIRNHGSLVRAVAEFGHGLGLTVVAEGVETAEQLALAWAARCDAVQGFLVSKPLPEPDARLFLEWAATTDEIARLLTAATVPSA